jgi:hypothetical protein
VPSCGRRRSPHGLAKGPRHRHSKGRAAKAHQERLSTYPNYLSRNGFLLYLLIAQELEAKTTAPSPLFLPEKRRYHTFPFYLLCALLYSTLHRTLILVGPDLQESGSQTRGTRQKRMTTQGHGCRRRSKSEPPRRLNIEPGVEADVGMVGCG